MNNNDCPNLHNMTCTRCSRTKYAPFIPLRNTSHGCAPIVSSLIVATLPIRSRPPWTKTLNPHFPDSRTLSAPPPNVTTSRRRRQWQRRHACNMLVEATKCGPHVMNIMSSGCACCRHGSSRNASHFNMFIIPTDTQTHTNTCAGRFTAARCCHGWSERHVGARSCTHGMDSHHHTRRRRRAMRSRKATREGENTLLHNTFGTRFAFANQWRDHSLPVHCIYRPAVRCATVAVNVAHRGVS